MMVKATARLKYVSIPPRKMRLVACLVKGLPVEQALNILDFTPRVAARHIAKTVKSAAANALSLEGTDHLRPESLVVKKITVDAAPTAKRIRFQFMGRAFRYRKRFSHLTVVLEGEADVVPVHKVKTTKAKKKEPTPSLSTAGKKTTSKKKTATKKTSPRSKKRKTAEEGE